MNDNQQVSSQEEILLEMIDELQGTDRCQTYAGEKHDVFPPCERRQFARKLANAANVITWEYECQVPVHVTHKHWYPGRMTWRQVCEESCEHKQRRRHPATEWEYTTED